MKQRAKIRVMLQSQYQHVFEKLKKLDLCSFERLIFLKDENSEVYIIYLRNDGFVLSKKRYNHWKEIQDEYDDFMTSLGPWSQSDVIEVLEQEYGMDDSTWPFTKARIIAFMKSSDMVLSLG